MSIEEQVTLYEVGLRDGLQNEPAFVPTDDKLVLARMLADAGLTRIELTSFVSPRWIPQLADHERVAHDAERRPGVQYSALVPNRRGLDGARRAHLDEVAIFLSATETHTQRNINKSISEALAVLSEVSACAIAAGIRVRGYISVVFGCPYEGAVATARVHALVRSLLDMGVFEVSLGDTIGVGNPRQVKNLVRSLLTEVSPDRLALHLHDTRGTALANVVSGLDEGIRTFDTSFGGLGGCPYAPGAAGNLATEDLVYLLDGMGCPCSVDLDRLILASLHVTELIGRSLPSKVLQAELARRQRDLSRRAKANQTTST
ncbi:MAG: hydroxymethylglutaryl-CoA lyase [Deltaproteobacteria bacterium]|nr:hydroxymethylglutaryl-CoA lyase [Deltaproteobacteria bacterium]